jgi:hypothetical protein
VAVNIIPRKVENYVIDAEYKERRNVVSKEISADTDSLKVDFYDNGEIDGDSISIFYNDKLIAFNRYSVPGLFILMWRWIPPGNTMRSACLRITWVLFRQSHALMVVTDGKKRYEIPMASSLEQKCHIKNKAKEKIFQTKSLF